MFTNPKVADFADNQYEILYFTIFGQSGFRIQEGSIKQGTFFLPGAIFRLRSSDLINPAKASVRGPLRLWGHGLGPLLILL